MPAFTYLRNVDIRAVWGAIGPLVGVLVGAYATRRWQRTQWLLDGKKTEYRELLSVLAKNAHILVKYLPPVAISGESL